MWQSDGRRVGDGSGHGFWLAQPGPANVRETLPQGPLLRLHEWLLESAAAAVGTAELKEFCVWQAFPDWWAEEKAACNFLLLLLFS